MGTDLVESVKMRAEGYGNRLRLSGEDAPISYPAFDKITERLAYGLEKIVISRGDYVVVIHPDGPKVLFGYYFIIKAGGVINDGYDTSGGIYVS